MFPNKFTRYILMAIQIQFVQILALFDDGSAKTLLPVCGMLAILPNCLLSFSFLTNFINTSSSLLSAYRNQWTAPRGLRRPQCAPSYIPIISTLGMRIEGRRTLLHRRCCCPSVFGFASMGKSMAPSTNHQSRVSYLRMYNVYLSLTVKTQTVASLHPVSSIRDIIIIKNKKYSHKKRLYNF